MICAATEGLAEDVKTRGLLASGDDRGEELSGSAVSDCYSDEEALEGPGGAVGGGEALPGVSVKRRSLSGAETVGEEVRDGVIETRTGGGEALDGPSGEQVKENEAQRALRCLLRAKEGENEMCEARDGSFGETTKENEVQRARDSFHEVKTRGNEAKGTWHGLYETKTGDNEDQEAFNSPSGGKTGESEAQRARDSFFEIKTGNNEAKGTWDCLYESKTGENEDQGARNCCSEANTEENDLQGAWDGVFEIEKEVQRTPSKVKQVQEKCLFSEKNEENESKGECNEFLEIKSKERDVIDNISCIINKVKNEKEVCNGRLGIQIDLLKDEAQTNTIATVLTEENIAKNINNKEESNTIFATKDNDSESLKYLFSHRRKEHEDSKSIYLQKRKEDNVHELGTCELEQDDMKSSGVRSSSKLDLDVSSDKDHHMDQSNWYNRIEDHTNSFPHLLHDQRKFSEFCPTSLKSNDKFSESELFQMNGDGYASCSEVSLDQTLDLHQSDFHKFGPSESTVSNSLFDFSKKTDDCNVCLGETFITFPKNSKRLCSRRTTETGLEKNKENNTKSKKKLKEIMEIMAHSKKVSRMTNITHSYVSDQRFNEESVQTYNQAIYKEKCIGTNEYFESIKSGNVPSTKTKTTNTEDLRSMNLNSTLDTLKDHVNNIIYEVDKSCQVRLGSALKPPLKQSDDECVYSRDTIRNFLLQIKHIYTFLDSKVNSNCNIRPQVKRQRCYSENVTNDISLLGSGDMIRDQDTEINFVKSKKVSYCANSGSIITQILEEDEQVCRTFELNPYDHLVRSYQSHTDRRIKAVGNKMKCKILIDGPICVYDSTNSCWNSRNKTAFRCVISGTSKDVVDKCLRCLQDTFPLSHLNEKILRSKLENKACV